MTSLTVGAASPLDVPSALGVLAVLAAIVTVVCRWLDLDTDTRVISTALGSEPVLGPLVRARPGLRLIGFPDEFEGAVMTVLGQQVS